MKILLAEDDENISVISRMVLEKIGKHEVHWVSDGEQALDAALSDEHYDVILLDEMMPKMNGLKVAKEYRSKCIDPTPIIFLSAKSQKDEIDKFLNEGSGFISKPFDPNQLCQLIEEILVSQKKAI